SMLNNQETKIPILIKDLGCIYQTEKSSRRTHLAIYQCGYCNKKFRTRIAHIKSGQTTSCGCKKGNRSHNQANTKLYGVWNTMRQRTSNQNVKCYSNYGNRGIKVCDRWQKFENFYNDMNSTYKDGLSIDRIDNDGNYEPSNCRWTTYCIQAQNTTNICSLNTTGYRGVTLRKDSGKYSAKITANGNSTYLGVYKTALEAAKVYDKYVIDNKLEHTINNVL
ncbi:hypothetical protein, partial [Poseidonibacter sp.]|uniref:hypothetical protein n=1 Tax=Poseidonibacter sp. TaxID=2321188 RepID=UPI003C724B54